MVDIAEIAAQAPDRIALHFCNSGKVVRYRELVANAHRSAQAFRALGLSCGDHLALLVENSPAFLEICCGAERAGLYYTPISTRLTAAEVAYILLDCEARIFILSVAYASLASSLRVHLPAQCQLYSVGGAIEGLPAWESLCAQYPATSIADPVQGRDMLYSSGTTGRPKGIKRPLPNVSPGTLMPAAKLVIGLYQINEETRYLSTAPLYHAAPLRYCLAVLSQGGSCFIMESFDPEDALRALETWRITHSQWVPTMFVRLLKLPAQTRARFDYSSLRFAIHAAAPCPPKIKEQMIEWWGPILYEYYAGTEGNGICVIDSHEWMERKGSVGRALLGEVRICDGQGRPLPVGETGIVYFVHGLDFTYHKDPEKTQAARNGEGWTTLGDIGYVDADGYLYLTDRQAFMIISGGVNIYPQETENILITHPKVADVAVFGIPDEDLGERVMAVVQPMDMREACPALAEELIRFCRQYLSPLKCPRQIDFDPELPRHPTGKLYKRRLRDRYGS